MDLRLAPKYFGRDSPPPLHLLQEPYSLLNYVPVDGRRHLLAHEFYEYQWMCFAKRN